jgi:hypothetical protein
MDSLLVGIRHSVDCEWSVGCQLDADLRDDTSADRLQPFQADGFVRTVDAIR